MVAARLLVLAGHALVFRSAALHAQDRVHGLVDGDGVNGLVLTPPPEARGLLAVVIPGEPPLLFDGIPARAASLFQT
jgi:hypothetical protein